MTPHAAPVPWPFVLLLLLAGCGPGEPGAEEPAESPETGGVELDEIPPEAAIRQTVYVPVYSHIYHRDGMLRFDLTTTLSIRNTDLDRPIILTSVRYHDSAGKLVREHLTKPLRLPPLASHPFVVAELDRSGGVGANFLVEWQAASEVSPPIVEAVMVNTASTQGISFVTRGEPVRTVRNPTQEAKPPE